MIHRIVQQIARDKHVPIAWNCGRIATLYEGKGDPAECGGSWVLLVLDHLAKVLSELLSPFVMPMYHSNLPHDQHGCVKGKSTDLANRIIRAMIEWAALAKMSIFVLSLAWKGIRQDCQRVCPRNAAGLHQGARSAPCKVRPHADCHTACHRIHKHKPSPI